MAQIDTGNNPSKGQGSLKTAVTHLVMRGCHVVNDLRDMGGVWGKLLRYKGFTFVFKESTLKKQLHMGYAKK